MTTRRQSMTLIPASLGLALALATSPIHNLRAQDLPTNDLLAYYTFDDLEDSLKDSGAEGADLAEAVNEPEYNEAGGFSAGAFSFDGRQRPIAPVDINPDSHPQLTMGAWVKSSTLSPGLRKVMGHDDGGWDRTIGLDDREGDFRYAAFVGNGAPLQAFFVDPGSPLATTSIVRSEEGSVTLTREGGPADAIYKVESNADLAGDWDELADGISEATFTHSSLPEGTTELYFRVLIK